ncbi:hypothetical protein [Hyphomicrobium sp. NDB2Meth4]|uniref:hypothetical protein n=1 Tax=Hyphomicrobium sp. NDB2Meth4 TaxID=1892846 RepID=UPI00093019ED|nr:hypothetical protein [Hyphomicrobium sp. NDB2Meth4]
MGADRGEIKTPKIERSGALKNRYCRGAKLTEHKFLRILSGYADGVPVKVLEPTTHVSGKTIRITYCALRINLPKAAQNKLAHFASAGLLLFDSEGVSATGRTMLAGIEKSRRFARYLKRHAPRLASSKDGQLFLIEKAVRIFCALDLRGVDVDEHLLAQIAEAFTALHPRDPLQKLADFIPGAKPHAHPELRLYEDYRRYLLKNPL